jgi:hypothetical protein
MSTDELLIEGVARGIQRTLESKQYVDLIAEKTAAALALEFEILTPRQAAVLLDVTKDTLQINHIEWGLDKSLALGPKNPRYLLSQIIERLKEKVVKGRRPIADCGLRIAETERSAA